MDERILVINPGSTSTKLAVYEEERQVWRESLYHPAGELSAFHRIQEQYDYRCRHVRGALQRAGIAVWFDAVVARGGLTHPIPGGVYRVNERVKRDLWNATM